MKLSKLRAHSKKEARPANIIRPFILVNIGIFVIAAIIWLYPSVMSWNNARDIISRQRQVYAAYLAQAGQYPGLQAVNPTYRILQYEYLASALADVQSLARHHGLAATHFSTSEPANHGMVDGRSFVEIQAIAEFTGQEHRVVEFTYGLAESTAFIRSLHMENVDGRLVELRVEFSLFGRGE